MREVKKRDLLNLKLFLINYDSVSDEEFTDNFITSVGERLYTEVKNTRELPTKEKEKEDHEREMSEISRKIRLLPPYQPLDIDETILKLLESEFQTEKIEEILGRVNHIIEGTPKLRHLIGENYLSPIYHRIKNT
ncbi:hypothetical protein JTB14_033178 [Gonioctena quinquepunctata]|nr:hypothetical protein JTB14_033178 [Gonioctena quinquepunctata]